MLARSLLLLRGLRECVGGRAEKRSETLFIRREGESMGKCEEWASSKIASESS